MAVLARLRRAPPSGAGLHHARRVLEICEEHGIGDWDLAFAYEALARAHAAGGRRRQPREAALPSAPRPSDVADAEDRALLEPTSRRSRAAPGIVTPRRRPACDGVSAPPT